MLEKAVNIDGEDGCQIPIKLGGFEEISHANFLSNNDTSSFSDNNTSHF